LNRIVVIFFQKCQGGIKLYHHDMIAAVANRVKFM
jgi:hypothetical protein